MAVERANCTVLLIDDEQAGLMLRKCVLENAGFKALAGNTGEEGMSLFRLHDVDVVVTDHLLGRATAAGMAVAMKRLKPHVPIVSLSGTTSLEEALKYADHFIGKAEGPEALIATLDRILSQQASTVPPVSGEAPAGPADLATLQALLAAIVEDSSDAILSKTLDGIVTTWNHSAEVMYGYTRREMIGKSVATLLPPDRPDEVTHILGRLKRGERIRHFETVRVAKDGRRLDVGLTISPICDGQGRMVGASTIARDISEQKNAEEALRRAEKLALAGRMASTVAHEINNPIEAIGNILYLLRNTVELNAAARKYVDTAHEELKRVADITRLTLGMQRGTADRRESVPLTGLLDNVLTLYQRKTKTLGIEVRRHYEFEGSVVGSPGELRQVFSNLIVNAMDALATTGDKLVLRVRLAQRWDTGVRGVRVTIVDNGPGIAPEHRSQLFQAFYTTKGDQGTGIGLWISRTIVRQHGGTLRLSSSVRPGRSGTCFSVFLPLENPVRSIPMP
jgi:PAS domain S-box-containing protein